jgi:hypothetical protein
MPLTFTGRFTQAFLDNPAGGTHTDGSGLYLAVRNGGKARSWSFRHRGKRRTIGSAFRISLKDAQALIRQFRDQLDAGDDPFAAPPEEEERETFREAVFAHYPHKCQSEWRSADAQALGRSMIRQYVDSSFMADPKTKISGWAAPCADKPLCDIVVKDMAHIFKRPTSPDDSRSVWVGKPVISKRACLMLSEMFDIAIPDGRHPGPNPALVTKNSPLRKILGKQPNTGHRVGQQPESVPELMAQLRTPLFAHGPDESTTAEAAEAIGCDPIAILSARKDGLLPSSYKLPGYAYNNATWVHKHNELEKTFRFRQPPRRHAEITLHARVLQFVVLTAVRSDMACGLLWDEVKWKRGIIDFAERHKMAEVDPEAEYTIPITDAVAELLETMRAQQRRDGMEDSKLVFVHGPTRTGTNRRLGRLHPGTVNSYYKRQLVRLDLVNGETDPKKMPSVHGLRNTFCEWACELNDYKKDHVDAQLGHKQPGGNWMYFRNLTYLKPRRGILNAWEKYCLSLVGAPSDNVIPLRIEEKTNGDRNRDH